MNCWACAPGLEKNDAAATAAAINFAFIRIIPPLIFRREVGRAKASGQPIQTTHGQGKFALLGHARGMAKPSWRVAPSTRAATGQEPIVARCRISFASGEAAVAASAAHVESIFLSGDEHETVERSTNDH